MRLAWFRAFALPRDPAAAVDTQPLDDSGLLIRELESRHTIEVFTATNAHEFVWKHFRRPYDVSVVELANTSAHAFVWPYLVRYPGVLLLRSLTVHDSRAHALSQEGRIQHYVSEFAFNEQCLPPSGMRTPVGGSWPMLRVPLLACRMAVLPQRGVVQMLQEEYPESVVRYAPLPVAAVTEDAPGRRREMSPQGSVLFGVLASDRVEVARRAMSQACAAGAAATLVVDSSATRVLAAADIVLSLEWPASGTEHTLALAAMACGKPVVTLESVGTTDWPAFDPQSWRPRGFGAPIAVTVDARDEVHSLMLAIRRLAGDASLRERLGEAGARWWGTHATGTHASEIWSDILTEARTLVPRARPSGWPAHLDADGSEQARAILGAFQVSADLF
jgi:hypothetical protein